MPAVRRPYRVLSRCKIGPNLLRRTTASWDDVYFLSTRLWKTRPIHSEGFPSSKQSTSHPVRIGDHVRTGRSFGPLRLTPRRCKCHRHRVLNGTQSSGRLEKTKANNYPAHHGLDE